MLYDHPELYDVAFSWDRSAEVLGLLRLFRRHAGMPMERVLEPASGPGRYAVAMARHVARVVGYDLRPEMTARAAAHAAAEGVGERTTFEVADMRDPPDPDPNDAAFDAAMNLVNSIGYLREDEDAVAHLAGTRAALRSGGVYVVQLSFGWADLANAGPAEWTGELDGAAYRLRWEVLAEDPGEKLSRQGCRLEVRLPGEEARVIEEEHLLRRWTKEDLSLLAREAGLAWPATYDDSFAPVPRDRPLTGESGNLYLVLR